MADDPQPMTDDEFEAAKQRVGAETARRAREAAAARADKLKPITDMMVSAHWSVLRDALPGMVSAAVGETYLPQVDALRQIVGSLDTLVPLPA